jgi:hypothetical protein
MKFQRGELQMAESMVEAARRIRPRRDGRHTYEQYFFYWTAFNHIYTTIANRKGRRTHLEKHEDGSIVTTANGNVNIPKAVVVSESEQIQLACEEFGDDLKQALILHEGTKYFVGRIPSWEGIQIEYDAFGQRINGVIKIHHTSDSQYPVWSPIDIQRYDNYLENPDDEEDRDFLTRQIVDLLQTVRDNFMHASRKFDDANDLKVVEHALPMLQSIAATYI